jgi:hypothetical protein
MVDRAHLDHFFRPPAWFYDEIEKAIELAAEGKDEELTDLDCRRYPVRELIEHYQLEELVEAAASPTAAGGLPVGYPDRGRYLPP